MLVSWNLLLLAEYRYAYLPPAAGADLPTMLARGMQLVLRKRFLLFGQVLVAPILLGLLMIPRKRLVS
jgi:hypothetical protein